MVLKVLSIKKKICKVMDVLSALIVIVILQYKHMLYLLTVDSVMYQLYLTEAEKLGSYLYKIPFGFTNTIK